jgi:hypothetical protein
MKNIFKFFLALSISGIFLFSCEKKEVGFDALTSAPDPNATYYVQFIDASKTLETGVTETGALVDATSAIAVSLMGTPQKDAITVNLTPDASNTLTSSMYTLSANSITIPAGKTSGSVNFSTITSKMPVGQSLNFALSINAGDHNSPSSTGTKLTYNLKRINFCPLEKGAASLVGSWSGTDATYSSSSIKTVLKGNDLTVSGMNIGFMGDFWGEEITTGGSFTMTVKGNGTVNIARQYIFSTLYKGAVSDYEIAGSGKWENCGNKPVLTITYDIYYVGDDKGIAANYSSYLNNIPYLTAVITLSN